MSTITTFGSVSIETSCYQENEGWTGSDYVCYITSISTIELTLHTTLTIPKGKGNIDITGCIVSPNGKIIFVDCYYNNRLVILNIDGTFDKEISCSPSNPFDVTYLDDTTVAVPTHNGIEIITYTSTLQKQKKTY